MVPSSEPGPPEDPAWSLPSEHARAVVARLNAVAARFFCDRLPGSWVPGYLQARGFGPDTQRDWHAGYAPAAWDALTRHLRMQGCPDACIEAAGLARRSRYGNLTDTFRDRAIPPIRSMNGTVIGFIGRAPDQARPGAPRYLNTRRTCLYDKGAALFGLWEAGDALKSGARPVLVEGPFDAIAVTTAGRGHLVGVAPCGTTLTARHVAALGQAADPAGTGIMVGFDPDAAGRHAAVRAYRLLLPSTDKLTLATFPSGHDAAQMLAEHGPATLAGMLSASTQPLADLVIDEDLTRWARWLDYPEGQINALRSATRLIAAMASSHVARQVTRLSERLGLSHATVTEAVTDALPDALLLQPQSAPPRCLHFSDRQNVVYAAAVAVAVMPRSSKRACMPMRRVS
jgi:DNA primase